MVRIWGLLAFALCIGAADAQTIKIGVITDRVGVSKPYSEPATEGVIFGADEINRRGGLLGRKIELLVEDDHSLRRATAAVLTHLGFSVLEAKDGTALDADASIEAHLETLGALYAGTADALPPIPDNWSSDMPSAANLATPFGMMWKTVHDEVDPNKAGSIVSSMNVVAKALGFPEFVEE